jgi:hypothetical protein
VVELKHLMNGYPHMNNIHRFNKLKSYANYIKCITGLISDPTTPVDRIPVFQASKEIVLRKEQDLIQKIMHEFRIIL